MIVIEISHCKHTYTHLQVCGVPILVALYAGKFAEEQVRRVDSGEGWRRELVSGSNGVRGEGCSMYDVRRSCTVDVLRGRVIKKQEHLSEGYSTSFPAKKSFCTHSMSSESMQVFTHPSLHLHLLPYKHVDLYPHPLSSSHPPGGAQGCGGHGRCHGCSQGCVWSCCPRPHRGQGHPVCGKLAEIA